MPAPDGSSARQHAPFRYRTPEALAAACDAVGVAIPFRDDIGPLLEPLSIGGSMAPNRLAVQPMEGSDAFPDGSPSDLTFERYRRFAAGGSGVIWFEATSVVPEGRSNRHQLMLTPATRPAFRRLVAATRRAAAEALGPAHRPVLVLQLTHSGRFSAREAGLPVRIACPNPHLDAPGVATLPWRDEELDALVERFGEGAALARDAGFDLVDVKACHGYLAHELLGARLREGRYGGAFEHRLRFLASALHAAGAGAGRDALAVRMNATDGLPYPWGFGASAGSGSEADTTEACEVARRAVGLGAVLLNVTAGIPARLPHVGRPFDRPTSGAPLPPEHPLVGVERLLRLAGTVQQAVPGTPVVGTGYSWLRRFWPNVGAAVVAAGRAAAIGLGRGAFAYPDAPLDLARHGRLDASKCCVACSYCSELMRARVPTACVVRDRLRYRPPVPPTPEDRVPQVRTHTSEIRDREN